VGLLPKWVDRRTEWHYPINARAETVREKRSFREAYANRPCLVPVSGFYERTGKRGAKRPYRICLKGGTPFALAGIWSARHDDGRRIETVAILTGEANAVVEPVHDGMPVALTAVEERTWFSSSRPAAGGAPGHVRRGRHGGLSDLHRGQRPRLRDPDLIEPLEHQQGEIDEFAG